MAFQDEKSGFAPPPPEHIPQPFQAETVEPAPFDVPIAAQSERQERGSIMDRVFSGGIDFSPTGGLDAASRMGPAGSFMSPKVSATDQNRANVQMGVSALEGFTLNAADEGLAWADSVLNDIPYEDALKAQRDKFSRIPDNIRVVGNVGGNIARELSPIGAVSRFAGKGALLPQMGKMGALGGAEGFTAGFAGGEGFTNRLEKGQETAALGVALGVGIPVGFYAVGKVLKPFSMIFGAGTRTPERVVAPMKRYVTGRDAAGRPISSAPIANMGEKTEGIIAALREKYGIGARQARDVAETTLRINAQNKSTGEALGLILNAMDDGQITPAMASAKIRRLGDRAVIADVDSSMTDLAETVAQFPGRARKIAERVLGGRQGSAADRLDAAVSAAWGSGNSVRTHARIVAQRSAEAKPFYTKFEARPPLKGQDLINWLSDSVDAQRAIKRAKGIPKFKNLADTDPQILDQVYKSIGGKANKAFLSGDGAEWMIYKDLRNELKDMIVKEAPEYGEALEIFSSASETADAIKAGEKFMKEEPEILGDMFELLSPGDREAFMLGVARAMRNMVSSGQSMATKARRLLKDKNVRARIAAVLPDARSHRQFDLAVLKANRENNVANQVLRGSPTAKRTLGVDTLKGDVDRIAPVARASTGSVMDMAELAGRIFGSVRKQSPDTIAEISRLLNTQGVEANEQILDLLIRAKSMAEVRGVLQRGMFGMGVAGTAQ